MPKAKGYAAAESEAPLTPYSFERREPREHDVAIDIAYCGICHSDIHQVRDEWGGSTYPMVPGHEITGTVSAVGRGVTRYRIGDRVGVGCYVDSCRTCPECQAGLQQYCREGMTLTYNAVERDGVTPTQGGYSDSIVVDEEYVLRIPDGLPLDAAAPLLCAGITLYSPLRHWGAGPGKKVAIVGLGGLGHMGVKLAHAMGADVTVLSHSASKRDDAIRLGTDHFYSTADPDVFERLGRSFDLIVNTVSAEMDWNQYLELLGVDGTMVVVGLPEHEIPIGAFPLAMGRRRLAGSAIGGLPETQEMLDFCGEHQITSDVEVIPIDSVNEAYDRVLKSDVRYRFVIDMATLG